MILFSKKSWFWGPHVPDRGNQSGMSGGVGSGCRMFKVDWSEDVFDFGLGLLLDVLGDVRL